MRIKTFGKLITSMALSLCVINLIPARCVAWGGNAHSIIAQIAYDRLSPDTQNKVKRLLGGATLASVSFWATDSRLSSMRIPIKDYVKIPFNDGEYDAQRDCSKAVCVVEAIKKYQRVLANPRESISQRALALKILVHFVADIHHPLHCIDNDDDEGYGVRVSFFGSGTNLKDVWDFRIIRKTGLSDPGYVKKLESALSQDTAFDMNVDKWASESAQAAREYVYKLPADRVLGNSYYRASLPVVDDRLSRAGVRLAKLIEDAVSNWP